MFAGPGTGKSTLAIGLVASMRKAGLRAEPLLENRRANPHGKSWGAIGHHPLPIAQIQSAMSKAREEIDFLVVESPILMRLAAQSKEDRALEETILALHRQDDSVNIFLELGPRIPLPPGLKAVIAQDDAAILEILRARAPDHFRIIAGDGALELALRAIHSVVDRKGIEAAAKQGDRAPKPRILRSASGPPSLAWIPQHLRLQPAPPSRAPGPIAARSAFRYDVLIRRRWSRDSTMGIP